MNIATAQRSLQRRLAKITAKLTTRLEHRQVRESDSGPSASAYTARVSVIIPVFNAMPDLGELLDSLENQDMGPESFELIAVNGGSTDGSAETLDTYAARLPNLRVIHQRPHGPLGKLRNVGIEASRSDYVFFCDAENQLGSETLRRMVDFADANQSDVLAPKPVDFSDHGSTARLFASTLVDAPLRTISASLTAQKMIRRTLLETPAMRFPEEVTTLEDGIMMTRCYLASGRNSILADYDYFSVRSRQVDSLLSSRQVQPEDYAQSMAKIARIIKEAHLDPAIAEQLVLDVYLHQALALYVPADYRGISADRQRAWVMAHAQFAREHIPKELEADLGFPYLQRSRLVRNEDATGLLKLADTEESLKPLCEVVLPNSPTAPFRFRIDSTANYDHAYLLAKARDTESTRKFKFHPSGSGYDAVLSVAELAELGPVLVDGYVQLRLDGLPAEPFPGLASAPGLPLDHGGIRVQATAEGNLAMDQRTWSAPDLDSIDGGQDPVPGLSAPPSTTTHASSLNDSTSISRRPDYSGQLVSEPSLENPMNRPVLMVTWGIAETFGGLTAMCLKRAGYFHEAGVPSAVVTLDPNPDLDSRRRSLDESGRLHPEVPLLNLHEYYASQPPGTESGSTLQGPDLGVDWYESARVTRSSDNSTLYVQYKSSENPKLSHRSYYRPDGSIYLVDVTAPTPENPERTFRTLRLAATADRAEIEFSSATLMYNHWLTEVVDRTGSDVIFDSEFTAEILFAWSHPEALKFLVFHSTHVTAGEDPLTGQVSSALRKSIRSRNGWDGIIFLTESQRTAFVQRFGDDSNTMVISNPVDGPHALPAFSQKDPSRVLHVGRFTTGKNIGAVINIIDAVAAAQVPVHLDLIGDGELRSVLEEQVSDLGIGHLVTFHGHVHDVSERLAAARVLLLCSTFEGQSLAILEAQANGCVPVAYDVDFGPRDIIRNERNGYLVPFGDEVGAIRAVERLLLDDELCARMSAEAFASAGEFSSEQIFIHWKEALVKARSNKKTRQDLATATIRLAGIRFHDDGGLDLEIAVRLNKAELTSMSLAISERGSGINSGQSFAPHHSTDAAYSFAIPGNLRSQFLGTVALDFYAILESSGVLRTIRLGVAPKIHSVPYLTPHGNLSFK